MVNEEQEVLLNSLVKSTKFNQVHNSFFKTGELTDFLEREIMNSYLLSYSLAFIVFLETTSFAITEILLIKSA